MTVSTLTSTTLVNVNAHDMATGQAAIGIVLAQAFTREHLRSGIKSFQYDRDLGIGILCEDVSGQPRSHDAAGIRQHLANALGLPREISAIKDGNRTVGAARKGHILGIPVTIWNREF